MILAGNIQNQKFTNIVLFNDMLALTLTQTNTHTHNCTDQPNTKTQTAPLKQEKTAERSCPVESMQLSVTQKKTYRHLKEVFLTFSRMQEEFNLRRDTPYFAYQIYRRCYDQPAVSSLTDGTVQCISLFLAAKYEEIYPPPLKYVALALKQHIDRTAYLKQEAIVLRHLRINLNLPILIRQLDKTLGEVPKQTEYKAQYLLELAITSIEIYALYQPANIMQAIALIATGKFDALTANDTIALIAKQLIIVRKNADTTHPSIFSKYMDQKYGNVSTTPL